MIRAEVDGGETVAAPVTDRAERFKEVARVVGREPFAGRTWSEFTFLTIGAPLAALGVAFVVITLGAGVILAITFFGLAILALSVRGATGLGGVHRQLARGLLHEEIEDPEPFTARPGFLGWLQSALRDRTGWRALAYVMIKLPLAVVGILVGFAMWWDAFFCLTNFVRGGSGNRVPVFGLPRVLFGPGFFSGGQSGFPHGLGVFCAGVLFFFAAPWAVRAVVYLDRRVMRVLLAPDALTARVRTLEQARAQTVDSSAATAATNRARPPRRHPGPAGRLGHAARAWPRRSWPRATMSISTRFAAWWATPTRAPRRPSSSFGTWPVASIRRRSTSGWAGRCPRWRRAARSPPSSPCRWRTGRRRPLRPSPTSAWPSSWPTWPSTPGRPGPAWSARRTAGWLRIVVRDDGAGGAQLSRQGSSSSGLVGLTDRVRAVDGRLDIVSPPGGPTVVTVDLPLHA